MFPAFGMLFLAMSVLAALGVVRSGNSAAEWCGMIAFVAAWNALILYFAVRTKDVWLEDDHLVVSGGRTKERIDLADIAWISSWPIGNYRPVWVTFSRPTAFGMKILFFDGYYFFNVGRSRVAEDLRRIVARRRARRRLASTERPHTEDATAGDSGAEGDGRA